MAPIRISRDQAVDLVDSNHFSLDELAFFVADGPVTKIYDNVDTTYFDVGLNLYQGIPDLFETWNPPSILLMEEESSVCPASLTVVSCNDSFSIPLYNLDVASNEISQFIASIPDFGDDEFPDDQAIQDNLWSEACTNMKRRALGLLSSYFARTPDGLTPAWYFSDLARIADDEIEYLHVVLTAAEDGALTTVCCWDEYWSGLEDHEGPQYRTTWKHNSALHVFQRDTQKDTVYFRLEDEDGHETFCAPSNSFDGIRNFLVQSGWTFTETIENSTTSVGANNNFGRVFGDVNVNSSSGRTTAVSPTPHVQPTQQRPGAPIESGIISGNVNITGLAQINGIVQGDVTVPSGSDVNLNGIVQGTVWVNGGTARLFGTISAAVISSGRIEIYGILESPLHYNGGDVYFHPNSIIG